MTSFDLKYFISISWNHSKTVLVPNFNCISNGWIMQLCSLQVQCPPIKGPNNCSFFLEKKISLFKFTNEFSPSFILFLSKKRKKKRRFQVSGRIRATGSDVEEKKIAALRRLRRRSARYRSPTSVHYIVFFTPPPPHGALPFFLQVLVEFFSLSFSTSTRH